MLKIMNEACSFYSYKCFWHFLKEGSKSCPSPSLLTFPQHFNKGRPKTIKLIYLQVNQHITGINHVNWLFTALSLTLFRLPADICHSTMFFMIIYHTFEQYV